LFPPGGTIDPSPPPTSAEVVEFLGLGMQQPSQYLGHGFDLTANTSNCTMSDTAMTDNAAITIIIALLISYNKYKWDYKCISIDI
jgi:hypothetical protein